MGTCACVLINPGQRDLARRVNDIAGVERGVGRLDGADRVAVDQEIVVMANLGAVVIEGEDAAIAENEIVHKNF